VIVLSDATLKRLIETIKRAVDVLEESVYWAAQDIIVMSPAGNKHPRKPIVTLEERLVIAGKDLTLAKNELEALLHGAKLIPPTCGDDHIEDT
jgi:hypothetical protein